MTQQPADSPIREHPAAAYHARRRSEVDAKILKTAREVLDNEGLAALTVERVAADSGVAKTTIYRRFKHRLDLATAAVAEVPEQYADANAVEIEDMREWVRLLAMTLNYGMKTRAAEVIGAGLMYRHDEEFSELFRQRIMDVRAAQARPRLLKAVERGEIRDDVDVDLIVNLISGAVVTGNLAGTSERETWLDDITKLVWSAIKPDQG